MNIHGLSRSEFGKELNSHLRPASPIDTIELLQGREQELKEIEHCLYTPGRHVFIYGDRGVGKSSLAQTAAQQYQSSDNPVLRIPCTDETTFLGAMSSLAVRVLQQPRVTKVTHQTEVNLKILKYIGKIESETPTSDRFVRSIEEALSLIEDISSIYAQKPVVIIDEFDAIKSVEEREKFSRFLKMMGDTHTWIPFIFSGIASSLDDLITGHLSSYRQIHSVYLDRLSWDGRWDIFKHAMTAFDIKYHDDIPYRIAGISDGFPFYVHTITEKLLWQIYENDARNGPVSLEEYLDAVAEAAHGIAPHLKGPYEKATERPSGERFHYVIWGAAATTALRRLTSEMYESYVDVVDQVRKHQKDETIEMLERSVFTRCLNDLTKDNFGCLLKRPLEKRKGFYEFHENMIRGYVKIVAEINGVEIWKKDAPIPRQYTSIPWGRVKRDIQRQKGSRRPSARVTTGWPSLT